MDVFAGGQSLSGALAGASRPASVALILMGFLAIYLWLAWRTPLGDWDALAMWNLRGRLIGFNPDPLVGIWLPTYYPHPDYPPLLPLGLAGGWRLVGVPTPWVPILLQGGIYLMMLWLLREQRWAMVLVGGVGVSQAARQMADLPLSLAVLGATVAWVKEQEGWMGMALGLGLLIKNEGALIAVCFTAIWLLATRRWSWRLLIPLFLLGGLLVAYKTQASRPNDLVSGSGGALDRIQDVQRWLIVGLYTLGQLLTWSTGAWIVLLLVLWFSPEQHPAVAPLVALGAIWAGYLAIYLTTPHNLVWHLSTSYDRLQLHLFPAVVYALSCGPMTNESETV